jgi:hypothetical protein
LPMGYVSCRSCAQLCKLPSIFSRCTRRALVRSLSTFSSKHSDARRLIVHDLVPTTHAHTHTHTHTHIHTQGVSSVHSPVCTPKLFSPAHRSRRNSSLRRVAAESLLSIADNLKHKDALSSSHADGRTTCTKESPAGPRRHEDVASPNTVHLREGWRLAQARVREIACMDGPDTEELVRSYEHLLCSEVFMGRYVTSREDNVEVAARKVCQHMCFLYTCLRVSLQNFYQFMYVCTWHVCCIGCAATLRSAASKHGCY